MELYHRKFIQKVTFKTAVIDIGSNSVRLVIFQGPSRSPEYFYNEKVICRLGLGVKEDGCLNNEGVRLASKALIRFSHLIKKMNVAQIIGVATAAVRNAKDGEEFLHKVKKETGIKFEVLSGKQEAQHSAMGVLFGWPKAYGLVCDIGGLSIEFSEIRNGKILSVQSEDLGPFAFTSSLNKNEQKKLMKKTLKKVKKILCMKNKSVFLVGGAWRALAKIDMELRGYPLKILHEYRMRSDEVMDTANWCINTTDQEIIQKTGISKSRASSIKHACELILLLIQTLQPEKFFVSSYGLREGLLFEKMDSYLKDKDPLIEASMDYENRSARFPGFGEELYNWISPIFPKLTKSEKRLVLSACLLHDTIWAAHPDYRAELCVETVTRANMGGIDHSGRLFLGLALAYRYKGADEISEMAAFKILREKDKEKAVILGKAMRLGSILSGSAPGGLKKTKISVNGEILILAIDELERALAGGVVKKRLKSLADSLNLASKIVIENVKDDPFI